MVKALHSTLIGEIKKIRPDLPPIRKKIWNPFIPVLVAIAENLLRYDWLMPKNFSLIIR